jgi:MarR family transcriptional regulator, organic hydroperoxide resistance regulator
MAVEADTVRRFRWAIASIGVHLEELNGFWGRALDISGPQWMILIILAELDQDKGIPVNAVARKLQVDSSFVTKQSKILEKIGTRASKDIGAGRARRADVSHRQHLQADGAARLPAAGAERICLRRARRNAFRDVTQKLAELSERLEKARLKATAGL